jgi:hypothetical protein
MPNELVYTLTDAGLLAEEEAERIHSALVCLFGSEVVNTNFTMIGTFSASCLTVEMQRAWKYRALLN